MPHAKHGLLSVIGLNRIASKPCRSLIPSKRILSSSISFRSKTSLALPTSPKPLALTGMVALHGAGIGAEKVQRCIARQDDGITAQLDVGGIFRELRQVLPEHIRPRPTRRQKDLVAPSLHRIGKRFTGEVPGGADLA